MKTLIACLVVAGIGAAIGYNINENRYGRYEARFGPFDSYGVITVAKALAQSPKTRVDQRPKVELPGGLVHDFGVMSPGDQGEHVFVVKNVGEADMTLEIGATTCKCTLGDLGDNLLSPGEQTEVKLSWTVKTSESTFGQSAELRTNDPDQIAIRFEIKGQVVDQMQIVPETVNFGEVAAGDPAEFEVRLYSYMNQEIKPGDLRFSSEEMNELAKFEVTPFEPGEDDAIHKDARQAFLVKATIEPGLKQGPVNQNLIFPFERLGEPIIKATEPTSPEEQELEDQLAAVYVAVSGRIVGALSMLTSTKLIGVKGGGYVYDFGKLTNESNLSGKALIMLKGAQYEATELSIGEVSPAENLEVTLLPPLGEAKTKFFTLQMTLKPGDKPVERLGLDQEDYGHVTIQSNDPKVPDLKLRLKFSLPAR